MSERNVTFSEGEFYHVYNRGNSKQVIFNSNEDYSRFVRLMYLSNSQRSFKIEYLQRPNFLFERGEPLVAIGAYCLMPNHFHMLITPLVQNGVSKYMQKLATGYSMFYNSKYERTGVLFEGKFKARHADTDEYLKYLYAYIHLNPVKLIDPTWKETGTKDAVAAYEYTVKYPYSSLQDYVGIVREEGDILDQKSFPEYFTPHKNIKNELFEWLEFTPDIL